MPETPSALFIACLMPFSDGQDLREAPLEQRRADGEQALDDEPAFDRVLASTGTPTTEHS